MEQNKKLRDLYDAFLVSKELKTILPEATEVWEKDKVLFESIYFNLDDSILHGDEDEDDENDGYYDAYYREVLGDY